MAFKEVRIYISTGDRERDKRLALAITQPFTWYMDALMRGRFKEYSGSEVKGINLVNLRLYTKNKRKDMEEKAGCDLRFDEWLPMLNTLQLESEIDLDEFNGSRIENVSKAIEVFSLHARKSNLPQMKILLEHLKQSLGEQSIEDAIEKADDSWKKLNEK